MTTKIYDLSLPFEWILLLLESAEIFPRAKMRSASVQGIGTTEYPLQTAAIGHKFW